MGEKKYYTDATQIAQMLEELAHAHDLEVENLNLRKRQKIKGYIGKGVFIIIFVLFVKIYIDINSAKANGQVPTVFGYQVYEVQTGSMDPTLPVNSLIVSKEVTAKDEITAGDIITFVHNQTTITHRVIEVVDENGETRYRTKGDNALNSVDPDLLRKDEIKARFIMKLPFYLSSSESEGDAS